MQDRATIIQRMIIDRELLDMQVVTESYDSQKAMLSALDAYNWKYPPIRQAPCLKVKATGEILPWNEAFAMRGDLCVACDENGNTDPASWETRGAATSAMTPEQMLPPAPSGLHFNFREFVPEDNHISMASCLLGIPTEYAQDFSDRIDARGAALPIPPVNVPVEMVTRAALLG